MKTKQPRRGHWREQRAEAIAAAEAMAQKKIAMLQRQPKGPREIADISTARGLKDWLDGKKD